MRTKIINIEKLDMSAVYYSGRSNTLSRYFSEVCSEMREALNVKQCPSHLMCTYCKTLFHPGNHKLRFISRHQINKKAQKLVEPRITQKMKRHLANNARNNKTYAVIVCLVCKKKTKLEGICKPAKIKAPVESPKELSRKEKKKLKKKAGRKQKTRNAGICIQSPSAMSSPPESPVPAVILPKSITVAAIKQPVAVVSWKGKESLPQSGGGKMSKAAHLRLQGMLSREKQKQQAPVTGLHSFLSSLH